MSSTNKTTHYELPQFVDSDIFNPLVDDNDAFDKIDTALHNIAGAEADDASEIVGVKSRLDSAEGDIDALEAQNGNSVLTTTAQTLSGAVNELDADVSALDRRVDIVEDDINNASTGLKAKVASLQSATESLYHGNLEDRSLSITKLNQNAIDFLKSTTKIIFMPVAYYESTYASGECTVLVTNDTKKVIMCDSGNSYSYAEIKSVLEQNEISHIDYFILSHYHADHFENIDDLITDGFIDDTTIAILPRTTTAPRGSWVQNEAQVRTWFANNTVITPSSNEPLIVDELKFDFMNCDAGDYAYYEQAGMDDGNNYSIAYYVTKKDQFTLFMTGDIGKMAVEYLNSRNLFKKCDILHVPHHAWGGDATDQPECIYLITRPAYAVGSLNRWNDMTVGEGIDSSEKVYLMNALGIPCYLCGYGVMYAGVGDNTYSFFPNGKQIVAETALENMKFNLYVDDTYTGISYGDVDHPFVSLTKALTFAKTLRASYVYIHIIGEYSHIEESISISWNGELQIGGTKNGDVNNVTIGIFRLYSGFARLTNINISGASNIAVASFHAYLMLESCVVDGDMTGATSLGNGRGIVANQNGYIFLDGTTVSNKRVALGCYDGGSITCDGLKGVNNEVLISGIQGGDVIVRDNSTVAYTTFVELIAPTDPRIPLRSAQFGKSKAYSSNSSYRMYHIDNTGTQGSVTLDFSSNIVKRKIVRLFNAQGAVYQFNVYAQSMTEPTVVQTVIDSSVEPNWAITYDRTAKTVTVTFENWVTAIVE